MSSPIGRLKIDDHCCPICDEPLDDQKEVVKTSCGHLFHREDLEAWLKVRDSCPCCQQKKVSYQTEKKAAESLPVFREEDFGLDDRYWPLVEKAMQDIQGKQGPYREFQVQRILKLTNLPDPVKQLLISIYFKDDEDGAGVFGDPEDVD